MENQLGANFSAPADVFRLKTARTIGTYEKDILYRMRYSCSALTSMRRLINYNAGYFF